jgi:micrococcal nuclease
MLVIAPAAMAGERCSAVDGETLRCGRERVRVEGLDAPNVKTAEGDTARQRLQRRLQSGEVVIERRGEDKYGRTLGRLYVSGQRITQTDLTAVPRKPKQKHR